MGSQTFKVFHVNDSGQRGNIRELASVRLDDRLDNVGEGKGSIWVEGDAIYLFREH